MTLPDLAAIDLGALARTKLSPVTVAVIDTGIDATHPDLVGRIDAAYVIAQEGETLLRRPVPTTQSNDVTGHGTGVAGIVAYTAPNARMIDVRALSQGDVGPGNAVLEGLRLALDSDARVINLSIALGESFREELYALCEACYRKNKTVVAAARNHALSNNGYPAEFSNCVSVDAGWFERLWMLRYLRQTNAKSGSVEFRGMGEKVTVPVPGGTTATRDGASFAAPAVSGLVALMLGAWGDLRPFEVKTILKAASI